jgi:transcriptional regulator with PAS, ATPase and Fis domain
MASYLSSSLSQSGSPVAGIIGGGPAMDEVFRITRRVARSKASVLLLGETGTGKELIASAVHHLSQRKSGPFVRVNCGALSENLLESELFGHVHGAFTGAIKNRTGRFEAAHTGTIFLDEINSTSRTLQVKLLRVLQEREFERVGDTQTIQVDVRVIAASNRDLMELVEQQEFREDLYWRLNVMPIREDIPALVAHFLNHYSEINDRYVVHIQDRAMEALSQYDWPGNVRELQNYVERAVVMAEGDELTFELLPDVVRGGSGRRSRLPGNDLESAICNVVDLGISDPQTEQSGLHDKIVSSVERQLIAQVMESCGNVQTKAATRLGINRNTLHKKLKEYGLDARPGLVAD